MKIILIACMAVVLKGAGLAAPDQHPVVPVNREQIAGLQKALALQRCELDEAFTDLNDLLTRYTEQHPKVLAKREQIARLQKALGLQRREHEIPQPSLLLQTRRELDEAFTDLNNLLTRYTEQHPKVLAKREQIARLQKALAPQ
jgi:hypothetical protein